MRVNRTGLTMIELLISLSLAAIVLAGILSIATSMVRYQLDGIRQGTVTGWAVTSYSRLVKEISDANVLVYPTADGQESDIVVVCTNWSRLMGPAGGKLSTGDPVQITYFCYDSAAKSLTRSYQSSNALVCPVGAPSLPPPCPDIPNTVQDIIALKVERIQGFPIFKRNNSIGGLKVRYAVGEQAATPNRPNPIFMSFETSIRMNKQYSNTAD